MYKAFQDVIADNENVIEFMKTWVENAGYPVVNVHVSSDRRKLKISQNRFLLNSNGSGSQDGKLWIIPITFTTNNHNTNFSNTKPTMYLSSKEKIIDLESSIEWIVFNVQQTGKEYREWTKFLILSVRNDQTVG